MSFKDKLKGIYSKAKTKVKIVATKVKTEISNYKFTQKHKESVVFSIIGLVFIGGVISMIFSFIPPNFDFNDKTNPPVISNEAPILLSFTPVHNPFLLDSESISFNVDVVDPDGDPLTYNWTLEGSFVGTNSSNYTYTSGNKPNGIYSVIMEVTDGYNSTVQEWTLSIFDCHLFADLNLDTIDSEEYQVLSAITSGLTPAVTTTDKIYYNTEQNKYAYYLDYNPADADTTMMFFLNGVNLTYGVDFYMSISVENRVIIDGINLSLSDIIYVVYNVSGGLEGDYETIKTKETSLAWYSNNITVNDRLDGYFIVDVTESNDPNFTSTGVTTGLTVNYLNQQFNYTVSLAEQEVNLKANKEYIWRVNSNKVYSGILDNIFITSNVSRTGKFKTNNEINSY